jgi:hypothetical protein
MLNEMERRALDMLLAGDNSELAVLRAQLSAATVASRDFTGVGFFTRFAVPEELPRAKAYADLVLGDLYAEVSGLENDAGFLLFVKGGTIDVLECFIVDDRWPDGATMLRPYYVRPAVPGSSRLVETEQRDLEWALRDTV